MKMLNFRKPRAKKKWMDGEDFPPDYSEHAKSGRKRDKFPWLVKVVVFGLLLAGAGAFFGLALKWAGDGYVHLYPGSWSWWESIRLGLCVMGSFAAVAVAAGFVAILIRPFWVAALCFLVSSLALFLTFEISILSLVVSAIYFVMGLIYLAGVRTEIAHRIRFSVWQIRSSQTILLFVLVGLACTSFYFGYADRIDREGFNLTDESISTLVEFAENHIIDRVVPASMTYPQKQEILQKLRLYLDEEVQEDMEPYEDYIPMAFTSMAFSVMMLATFVLSWLPLLLLSLVFFILLRLKLVKRKAQPIEITRLTIQ
jgi:hypothetical protein